jgi:truncated hemoglobin YjbI
VQVSQNLENLIAELGGTKKAPTRIEQILTAFYETMSRDTMLGFFFAGKDLKHIIEQQKMFLLRALGEEVAYSGKSPARAHTATAPILDGHFDRRLLLLAECLQKNGLSEGAVKTWVGFEAQFRKVIVKK